MRNEPLEQYTLELKPRHYQTESKAGVHCLLGNERSSAGRTLLWRHRCGLALVLNLERYFAPAPLARGEATCCRMNCKAAFGSIGWEK